MGERPDDHRGMDPQTTRQGRLLSGEGTPVKGRGARLDRLPLTAFGSKAGCGHLRRKGGNAMSFRGDGKVYLEVEVNEEVSKDENPNVPYGAEETARDVVDCIQHGARVVRYHARYDDGRPAWVDDEVSRAIVATPAREVDPLAYPGYQESFDRIWALAEHPPADTGLLVAPFGPAQHVKRFLWQEDENQFKAVDFAADDRFIKLGLAPQHRGVQRSRPTLGDTGHPHRDPAATIEHQAVLLRPLGAQ